MHFLYHNINLKNNKSNLNMLNILKLKIFSWIKQEVNKKYSLSRNQWIEYFVKKYLTE